MSLTFNTQELDLIKQHITDFPDFPSPGILFRDVFGVYRHVGASKALHSLLKSYALKLKNKVDVVYAIESRGFLIGPYISQVLEIPFVPIRKKGKLPGKLEGYEYALEYGKDYIEVQADGAKVGTKALIVDDLIATGGSLHASCTLLGNLGIEVVECFVIMELSDLNGRKKITSKVTSLIQY